MKKIRFIKKHMRFSAGAVLTTKEIFADSWVKAGIAEYVKTEVPNKTPIDSPDLVKDNVEYTEEVQPTQKRHTKPKTNIKKKK